MFSKMPGSLDTNSLNYRAYGYYAISIAMNIFILSRLSSWHTIIASIFVWVLLGLPGMIYTTRLRHFTICSIAAGLLLGTAVSIFFIAVFGSIFDCFGRPLFLSVPIVLSAISLSAVKIYSLKELSFFKLSDRDIQGFSIPLWLTFLLTALPLMSVGAFFDGHYHYSPFFCADFFKHMAYSQALNLGHMPPIDLFSHTGRLGYYWVFYIIPSSILNLVGSSVRAEEVLLTCNVIQTDLFILLLYSTCRRFGAKPAASMIAVIIGILSLNLDGIASLILDFKIPVGISTQLVNIEAIDITRILGFPYNIAASSLFRLCLYVPQHRFATMLFLTWLLLSASSNRDDHIAKGAIAFIPAVLPSVSLLYGAIALAVIVAIDISLWIVKKQLFPFAAIMGASIGVLMIFWTGIFNLQSPSIHANNIATITTVPALASRLVMLIPQFIGSFGGIFLIGTAGAIILIKNKNNSHFCRLAPTAILCLGFLAYFVTEVVLNPGRLKEDIQLKISFLFLIGLVLGTSLFLTYMKQSSKRHLKAIKAAVFALLLLGIPSIVHDVRWHSILLWDWASTKVRTVSISEPEMQALDWVRLNTERTSVFAQDWQKSYLEGGLDAWIPVFSGRRILASSRGTRLNPLVLEQNRRLFKANDGDSAHEICKAAHIDYIYNSRVQSTESYERMESILSRSPTRFHRNYFVEGVSIWQVIR
jgi:hypothetical protein